MGSKDEAGCWGGFSCGEGVGVAEDSSEVVMVRTRCESGESRK